MPRGAVGQGVEHRSGAFVLGDDPGHHLGGLTILEPAIGVGDVDAVQAVDEGHPLRRRQRARDWRADQPRPMFGRLPWFAFERRIRALRFLVFFDMRDHPTL